MKIVAHTHTHTHTHTNTLTSECLKIGACHHCDIMTERLTNCKCEKQYEMRMKREEEQKKEREEGSEGGRREE